MSFIKAIITGVGIGIGMALARLILRFFWVVALGSILGLSGLMMNFK